CDPHDLRADNGHYVKSDGKRPETDGDLPAPRSSPCPRTGAPSPLPWVSPPRVGSDGVGVIENAVLSRLTSSDAGEVLTVQRAAYVTEARAHDDLDMPPLVQSLDQLA